MSNVITIAQGVKAIQNQAERDYTRIKNTLDMTRRNPRDPHYQKLCEKMVLADKKRKLIKKMTMQKAVGEK